METFSSNDIPPNGPKACIECSSRETARLPYFKSQDGRRQMGLAVSCTSTLGSYSLGVTLSLRRLCSSSGHAHCTFLYPCQRTNSGTQDLLTSNSSLNSNSVIWGKKITCIPRYTYTHTYTSCPPDQSKTQGPKCIYDSHME